MNFKKFIHYKSYVQYPLMLTALFYVLSPYITGLKVLKQSPEILFDHLNTGLIFMGLATSFSSLQDTTKTQNKLSRKIWKHPVKGKITLVIMCLTIFFFLVLGLLGYFNAVNGALKTLSVGIIVFSLGMFGLLKAAMEMFENHRKDND